MLDSRTFVQLEKDLKGLGLESEFKPVSSYPKVEVAISLSTLLNLITRAQQNQVSVPVCGGCRSTTGVAFGRIAGNLVAYCPDCRPDGIEGY